MGGDPNPYFLSNFSTCVSTFSREKGGGQSLNIFLLRLGHFPKKSRVTKIQTFEENYSVCHKVFKKSFLSSKNKGGERAIKVVCTKSKPLQIFFYDAFSNRPVVARAVLQI